MAFSRTYLAPCMLEGTPNCANRSTYRARRVHRTVSLDVGTDGGNRPMALHAFAPIDSPIGHHVASAAGKSLTGGADWPVVSLPGLVGDVSVRPIDVGRGEREG